MLIKQAAGDVDLNQLLLSWGWGQVIVVRAFFDSILAEKAEDREAAREFPRETLPAELVEVEYARATGP